MSLSLLVWFIVSETYSHRVSTLAGTRCVDSVITAHICYLVVAKMEDT